MVADELTQRDGLRPGNLAAIIWWRSASARRTDLAGLAPAQRLAPVLRCGWAANWDYFTVVRASSLDDLNGLAATLARCGHEMTAVLGRRDLDARQGPTGSHAVWFAALWRWNDAWHRASAAERRAYDADVDQAFTWAHNHGVATLGRYACSWSSGWDHFTVWAVPSLDLLDECMHRLGAQRDWRFAQSYHYIGRPVALAQSGGWA